MPSQRCILWVVTFFLLLGTFSWGEELPWPGVEYSYVKGYFYYPEGEEPILGGSLLNPSVEKIVALSKEDEAALRAALVKPPEEEEEIVGLLELGPDGEMRPAKRRRRAMRAMSMCYVPHHAFIFFDAFRKPVAHVEICFMCKNTSQRPPLPREYEWNFPALETLCRKLQLPLPRDPEFQAVARAVSAQSQKEEESLKGKEKPLAEALEKRTSPPIEDAWPWMPYKRVRLYVFNEGEWNPYLVHLGKVTDGIRKSMELNSDQQRKVWNAFAPARPPQKIAPHLAIQIMYDGSRHLVVDQLGRIENPTEDRKTIRQGLVCFDQDDQPVAWLSFSAKDGQRLMHPRDGIQYTNMVWDPFVLGKVFEELGMGMPSTNPEADKK